jgi:hypothetical protein
MVRDIPCHNTYFIVYTNHSLINCVTLCYSLFILKKAKTFVFHWLRTTLYLRKERKKDRKKEYTICYHMIDSERIYYLFAYTLYGWKGKKMQIKSFFLSLFHFSLVSHLRTDGLLAKLAFRTPILFIYLLLTVTCFSILLLCYHFFLFPCAIYDSFFLFLETFVILAVSTQEMNWPSQ